MKKLYLKARGVFAIIVFSFVLISITQIINAKSVSNRLIMYSGFFIPEGYGASNRRLILTPFLLNSQTGDTLQRLDTIVIDGEKYKCKSKVDPFVPYIDKRRKLTKECFMLQYQDTTIIPNVIFKVVGHVEIRKKGKAIYKRDVTMIRSNVKKPFLFLEIPPFEFQADSQEDRMANQVVRYIKANEIDKATTLADSLPDNGEFKKLKFFCECFKWNFDFHNARTLEERETRREIFEFVQNSSPMNKAVMYMAMDKKYYDVKVKKVLDELPQTTEVKYMKLQLFFRELEGLEISNDRVYVEKIKETFETPFMILDEIVKEKPEYLKIAENDGELSREFMDYYKNPRNWENQIICF